MQFGGQFERRKPAPAQLSLWQASFFFFLVVFPYGLARHCANGPLRRLRCCCGRLRPFNGPHQSDEAAGSPGAGGRVPDAVPGRGPSSGCGS